MSTPHPGGIARRRAALVTAVALGTLGTLASLPLVAHATTAPAFSTVSVSSTLAGGEPLVAQVPVSGGGTDLVYSSHEGTTHLFRDGLISPDTSNICSTPTVPPQNTPSGYACSYTNQVNVWTSTDSGQTWTQSTTTPVGGPTSPFGLGFSDPDLTVDESGILYNTGIDLANDAVFASIDGGKTWNIGNNNCHSGDRPWLAGGVANQVFLATDTTVDPNTNLSSGHEIFLGTVNQVSPGVGTISCVGVGGQPDPSGTGSTGIPDYGTDSQNSALTYTAEGKLFYDHNAFSDGDQGALIDPVAFSDGGTGISILKNAAAQFTAATPAAFQQFEIPNYTGGVFAHWPSIALDNQDNVYLTWDTTATSGGNLNNGIDLAVFNLQTQTWGPVTTITHPGTSVLWPWVTVGNPGNAAVVWYQYAAPTNPDSGTGDVSLFESTVSGADTATPTVGTAVDAVGSPIHNGGMCQSGTTCVATGQDRRLGDFFTDSIDSNGCVLIASGETSTDPSAATSRPIFVHQTSGTSLTGLDCAAPASNVPEAPMTALLLGAGALVATAAVVLRRRRNGALAV